MCPDTETWRVNVVGTYNVIEAAVKMGVRKIILASSETTYGICFADGVTDPHYLPLDEGYDIDPMDTYGTSKKVNEVTGRSFAQRSGADIYALRIGNVVEPHEYATLFPGYFADPGRAATQCVQLCRCARLGADRGFVPEKGWPWLSGVQRLQQHQRDEPAQRQLLARYFPGVPVTRALTPDEALMSNAKARDVLGFQDQHDWRDYVKG